MGCSRDRREIPTRRQSIDRADVVFGFRQVERLDIANLFGGERARDCIQHCRIEHGKLRQFVGRLLPNGS
jgi:hypothetical protein